MPYFRPFESYALFLLQKMNTLGTQSAPSQPAQPRKSLLHATHAYVFIFTGKETGSSVSPFPERRPVIEATAADT